MNGATNFCIQEFVSKAAYEKMGEHSTRLISPKLPVIAQTLRNYYNKPVTINNWVFGGEYNWSGTRTPECPEYSPYSGHSRGLANDVKVEGIDSLEVQKGIIANYEGIWKELGVTMIEVGTKGWTHIGVEWFENEGLWVYDVTSNTFRKVV